MYFFEATKKNYVSRGLYYRGFGLHSLNLPFMALKNAGSVITENLSLYSEYLKRDVNIDCYIPILPGSSQEISLLLINDGQDLPKMPFDQLLDNLYTAGRIEPLFCVGIHCAADRKNEYGTAKVLDYKGRGAKAIAYNFFVMQELMPFLRKTYHIYSFREKAFAGFSLGGLSAIDMVWNQSEEFSRVGVFSGSLWWRDKDHEDGDFDEDVNRIMQKQIRQGVYRPWLKFFFEVGTLDETSDRNNNGIIDSIDDTRAVINELEILGYQKPLSIYYLELQDGRHDVPTWAKAFPVFLEWGWGKG